MPFLGQQPAEGYRSIAKQTITGNSGTSYSLDYKVTSANDIEVFVNNVRQEPGVAYTASGTTITFSDAITSTDSCYVVFQARAVTSNLIESQNLGTNLEFTGDYIKLPSGTTAQRPASPSTSNLRFNTSLGIMEFYNGSTWQAMDVYGANTYPVKYTIVGAGGGGGRGSNGYAGGGAGAGGVIQGTFFATVGTTYTITVGAGGAATTQNISYSSNGADSSIAGGFNTLTAYGGSRGGNTNYTGDVWGRLSDGACGGGGGSCPNWSNNTGYASFGGGGSSQGSAGGHGGVYSGTTFNGGGGGGGAGKPGSGFTTGNGPVGGAAGGGNGIHSIINGNVYGGGGGGGYGSYLTGTLSNGGSGGGGRGGNVSTSSSAGTANTGGGGGGGGSGSGYENGGNGGSGIVIVSLPSLRYTSTTTGSPSVSTSGSDTILTFTSSGSFVA